MKEKMEWLRSHCINAALTVHHDAPKFEQLSGVPFHRIWFGVNISRFALTQGVVDVLDADEALRSDEALRGGRHPHLGRPASAPAARSSAALHAPPSTIPSDHEYQYDYLGLPSHAFRC